MSHVNNAILHLPFEMNHEPEDRVKEVNKVLKEKFNQEFVLMDIQKKWYGGHKVFEADIAVAAFNYVSPDEILRVLKGIDWETPQDVQLIYMDQNDDHFTIMTPESDYLYPEGLSD